MLLEHVAMYNVVTGGGIINIMETQDKFSFRKYFNMEE